MSIMSKTPETARPAVKAADPLWVQLRNEAEAAMTAEPALGSFIFATVLSHEKLEDSICHRLAQRLDHKDVDAGLIGQTFQSVLDRSPELGAIVRADLAAVYDRDPACTRYLEPLLYFKGFHALVTHRFAHQLWKSGRKDYAFYLQSQSSRMFAVDIHPAARIGKGIMLDHATGFVVGETATIGDNVSILQGVTLGGTGKSEEDRHPKIGNGVLIGAGAIVLGNIKVGDCARIGAGSVVVKEVPPRVTVAGVPARIIGEAGYAHPASVMDHVASVNDISG